MLAGFAPFDSAGLAIFRVASGVGQPLGDPGAPLPDDQWQKVETDTLFHTLSSRFGGGGVLIYAEYAPQDGGPAGLLLIDLRHGGLADLSTSLVDVPDNRRVEVYFQQWKGRDDLFESERASGEIQVVDMLRGEELSAVALEFDLTFSSDGPDGIADTDDDRWRRVQGRATTSPTVAQAVDIESSLAADRRREEYAPDGNIHVSCVGDTYVEESQYDEDSYYYEDTDSGGCEGDTWEDDSTDPQESGGCAGERSVDDGAPDPDGGCEGSGDDYDESDFEEDDTYYDSDDTDESSGCEGDSGSDDFNDDSDADSGCDTSDDSDTDDDDDDDDTSSDCEGDDEVEASVGFGQRAYLRRVLMSKEPGKVRPRRAKARRSGPMRFFIRYLPFMLLGLVIHTWRRRVAASPR